MDNLTYSYDEFVYYLGLHVPFQDRPLSDADKRHLYEDFLMVSRKLQAEPMDYIKYRFYAMDDKERETYLTRKQYEELCISYNTQTARKNITDKRHFAKVYRTVLGREVLNDGGLESKKGYSELCKSHEILLCKPVGGGFGSGIYLLRTNDQDACDMAWNRFLKGDCLIEEFIDQDEILEAFHPSSVNTIRSLTTVSGNGQMKLIAAAIRTGRGGSRTDNSNGGGIFANIDVETGRITGAGRTHFGEVYETHPDTGVRFEETVLPCWEAFLEASLETASVQPELRLCCWDWALKRDGTWALIEGNLSGGAGLNQLAVGKGLKREILDGLC